MFLPLRTCFIAAKLDCAIYYFSFSVGYALLQVFQEFRFTFIWKNKNSFLRHSFETWHLQTKTNFQPQLLNVQMRNSENVEYFVFCGISGYFFHYIRIELFEFCLKFQIDFNNETFWCKNGSDSHPRKEICVILHNLEIESLLWIARDFFISFGFKFYFHHLNKLLSLKRQ